MICSDMRTMRISIHALHEESDVQLIQCDESEGISIHALHEESDYASTAPDNIFPDDFNPRSP